MTEGVDGLDAAETPVEPRHRSGEGSVTLVGTAHVSQDSVDEVEATIAEEEPDVVAVELDEARYKRLKGETPDDVDAADLIAGRTVYQFLAYWLLSYVQARLGDRFDVEPGADMMAAVDAAEEQGAGVALVDRNIQLTVRRLWSGMRLREKFSVLAALTVTAGGPWQAALGLGYFVGLLGTVVLGVITGSVVLPPVDSGLPLVGTLVGLADSLLVATGIALAIAIPLGAALSRAAGSEDELDVDTATLTDADVVTAMIEEFRRFSPGGAEALIDERDAFITYRLLALREAGYRVVAVVGAGHRQGIESYLEAPTTLPPRSSLVGEPTTGRLRPLVYKGIGYVFTLGFLVFFLLLAMAGVRSQFLLGLFLSWFLVNGVIAAGLARLAGAHWASAGVGGAVAWLTSVNPLLAPGWFAGYVELRYTSVNVADISRLNTMLKDDETPVLRLLRRMRSEVPLFRLLLIVGMTNVGSFLASVLFATVVLPWLATDIGGIGALGEELLRGARNSAELLVEAVT